MALSGGHTGTAVGGFSLQINWTATQDTPNNKSTITAKAYIIIASGWSINIGSRTGIITIDGTDTTITYNLGSKGAGTHHIGTATKTITHNTDGTKSFSISGNAKIEATVAGYGWIGTLSKGSNTYTLDAIPRVSSISLNYSSREIGQSVRITVSRPNNSFTNDIAYQFGNESWVYIQKGVESYVDWTLPDTLTSKISGSSGTLTIYNETKVDGTYIGRNSTTLIFTIPGASTFTIPTSFTMGSAFTVSITRASDTFTHWVELWDGSTRLYSSGNTVGTSDSIGLALSTLAARSPNSMVRSFTVKVSTYNGSTHIGSTSKTITGNVPSSVKPSFSALTVSENVSEVNTLVGAYVQGKSRLDLAIVGASGKYGSSIRSYSISGAGHSASSSSTTTGVLQAGGNQYIHGTITDSRGQTYTRSIVVNVLSYSPPTVTDLSFKRTTPNGTPDASGTNVTVTAKVRVNSLVVNGVEINSIRYNVQSAQRGQGFVNEINTTSPYLDEDYNNVLSGFAADYPYDFRARAGDIFGFSGWSVGVTPTGAVTQQWGKTTTSFGKMIDDISYNVQVGSGGIHSEGQIVAGLEGIFSEGGYVINEDAYSTNNTPDWYFANYTSRTVIEQKRLTDIGISGATGYGCILVTFVPFTDTSGNKITQVAYGQAGEIYSRNNGTVNWESWQPVGGGGGGDFSPIGHTHSASDINSGTLSYLRIPRGTTSTTVAIGNHTHSASDINSGTLSYLRIPRGTTSTTVAIGNHTHSSFSGLTVTNPIVCSNYTASTLSMNLKPNNSNSGGNIYAFGNIRPSNGQNLGGSATAERWSNLYIRTGAINESSDLRLKDNVTDIPKDLLRFFADEVKPKMFEVDGKTHFGYIAQDVERALYKYALEKVGLENAREYVDEFNLLGKGESYLSLVYNQVAVLKEAELQDRIDKLEMQIEELKGV